MMQQITIFKEVFFKDFEIENLIDVLNKSNVGQYPLYLNALKLDIANVKILSKNLLSAFEHLGMHPQLPFPTYIINPHMTSWRYLKFAKSIEELPRHYVRPPKRPKPHENSLMEKNNVLCNKLLNMPLTDLYSIFYKNVRQNSKLFSICKENYFLDQVQKNLEQYEIKKNEK